MSSHGASFLGTKRPREEHESADDKSAEPQAVGYPSTMVAEVGNVVAAKHCIEHEHNSPPRHTPGVTPGAYVRSRVKPQCPRHLLPFLEMRIGDALSSTAPSDFLFLKKKNAKNKIMSVGRVHTFFFFFFPTGMLRPSKRPNPTPLMTHEQQEDLIFIATAPSTTSTRWSATGETNSWRAVDGGLHSLDGQSLQFFFSAQSYFLLGCVVKCCCFSLSHSVIFFKTEPFCEFCHGN